MIAYAHLLTTLSIVVDHVRLRHNALYWDKYSQGEHHKCNAASQCAVHAKLPIASIHNQSLL
jgi:hypothetical protein